MSHGRWALEDSSPGLVHRRGAGPTSALDAARDLDVVACNGAPPCTAAVAGFFAGPAADRLAVVVHIFKGQGGKPTSVTAVLVFKKS